MSANLRNVSILKSRYLWYSDLYWFQNRDVSEICTHALQFNLPYTVFFVLKLIVSQVKLFHWKLETNWKLKNVASTFWNEAIIDWLHSRMNIAYGIILIPGGFSVAALSQSDTVIARHYNLFYEV